MHFYEHIRLHCGTHHVYAHPHTLDHPPAPPPFPPPAQVEEMAQKHAHRVYFVHLRNVKRLPQLHSTPDADAASLGPDDAIPSFIGPGGGCGARARCVLAPPTGYPVLGSPSSSTHMQPC